MCVATKLPWWIGRLSMFIGVASNPFADPFQYRVHRLAKKVEAGIDFIQTQCIYDMKRFKEFMKQAVDMGLHEKCKILAGVTPLKSVGMARYMAAIVSIVHFPPLFDRPAMNKHLLCSNHLAGIMLSLFPNYNGFNLLDVTI